MPYGIRARACQQASDASITFGDCGTFVRREIITSISRPFAAAPMAWIETIPSEETDVELRWFNYINHVADALGGDKPDEEK